MQGLEQKIANLRSIQRQFVEKEFKNGQFFTPRQAWQKRKYFFNFGNKPSDEHESESANFDYSHNPFFNRSLGYFDYRPQLPDDSESVGRMILESRFEQRLQLVEDDIRNKISQFQKKASEMEAEKEERIMNFILNDSWENVQQSKQKVQLRFSDKILKEMKISSDKF